MISVKVNQINGQRLARLARELDYISAAELFRTIPLAEEGREVLDYMEEQSPASEHISETKLWLAQHGLRALLPKFAKSWRIKRVTQGNRLMWQISNVLESKGVEGRAKFRSVEFGSRSMFWTARRGFKFKDMGLWHSIEEGQEIHHAANEPAGVINKTLRFIERVMIPRISRKIRDIVDDRLDDV